MKYEIKTPALIKHMYPEWWEENGEWFNEKIESRLDNARVMEIEKFSENQYSFHIDGETHHYFLKEKFDIIVMGPYIPKGAEVLAWDDDEEEKVKSFFNCWEYCSRTENVRVNVYDAETFTSYYYDHCELYTEPKEITRPYTEEEILDMVISGEWYCKSDIGYAGALDTSIFTDDTSTWKIYKRGWPKDKWVDPVVVERVEG